MDCRYNLHGKRAAVWIERMREAVNSEVSNAQWCREHGIGDPIFKRWKQLLRKEGILPSLYEYAQGFVQTANGKVLTFNRQGGLPAVHFIVEPIASCGEDYLYWQIRALQGIQPESGDLFLFVRTDRETLYGLQYCGGGFRFLRSRLERGRFPWPKQVNKEGNADITTAQLAQILRMAGT